MYIIWIIIVGTAIGGAIEGFIKARRERNRCREYEKYKYNPYTTRGFNTLHVFESNDSFCVSDDPDYFPNSFSEEEDTLDYDNNLEVPEQKEQPVEDVPDDEYVLEEESEESKAAYESLKAIREQMEPIEPVCSEEYESGDFTVIMSQPISLKAKILRSIVNI